MSAPNQHADAFIRGLSQNIFLWLVNNVSRLWRKDDCREHNRFLSLGWASSALTLQAGAGAGGGAGLSSSGPWSLVALQTSDFSP